MRAYVLQHNNATCACYDNPDGAIWHDTYVTGMSQLTAGRGSTYSLKDTAGDDESAAHFPADVPRQLFPLLVQSGRRCEPKPNFPRVKIENF